MAGDIGSLVHAATGVEKALIAIWADALGVPNVGCNDDFFALGGDIHLALRLAETIRNHLGIEIPSEAIVENPTVRGFARVLELAVGNAAVRCQDKGYLTVEGAKEVENSRKGATEREFRRLDNIVPSATRWPLAPIQRWLLEKRLRNPNLWNLSLILATRKAIDLSMLRLAVYRLISKHEALRLQFAQHEAKWIQYVNQGDDERTFQCFDLSGLSDSDQTIQLLQIGNRLHESLVFGHGLLVRFAAITLAPEDIRFLIIAHHLVCDGLSLQIIVSDLTSIYNLITSNENGTLAAELPPPSSFVDWVTQMNSDDTVLEAVAEQSYWAPKRSFSLPMDFPNAEGLMGSADFVRTELDSETTAALITRAHDRYRTGIDTIALWGGAVAIMTWTRRDVVAANIVGHGRDTGGEELQLYGAVGWFNIHYPVVLEFSRDLNPSDAIPLVRHEIESVPNHGVGFGVLRYIYNEKNPAVPLKEEPEFGFNYVGDYDLMFNTNKMFRLSQGNTGAGRDPRDRSVFKLGLFCSIRDKKLRLDWFYTRDLHRRRTIEALSAECIRRMRLVLDADGPSSQGTFLVS